MADESTQSITIEAPPGAIMAVIADFDRYPEWAGSVQSAQVVEDGPDGRARRVAFTVDARVFRDEYELEYDWRDDEAVHWHLVAGQMQRAQQGSYTLHRSGAQTTVTYTLAVDLAMPMLGMLKRKAERVVMDTALRGLKRRVETTSSGA